MTTTIATNREPRSGVNAMQIVHDMRTVKVEGPTILTIGNFDGLHRGHQALLATVMATAPGRTTRCRADDL